MKISIEIEPGRLHLEADGPNLEVLATLELAKAVVFRKMTEGVPSSSFTVRRVDREGAK